MTTSPVLSNLSFGTGSNVGELYHSTHGLALTTTTALVVVKSVQTSADNNRSSALNVRYVWSPNLYASPLEACNALKGGSRYVELRMIGLSLTNERCSLPIATAAGYLYLWVEAPTLPTAATVSVSVVETP